jgi:hypothetical protein
VQAKLAETHARFLAKVEAMRTRQREDQHAEHV